VCPSPQPRPREARDAAGERAREAAAEAARIADGRRAFDVVVLHVEELINVTDYFVIASAGNKRQIRAIARDIVEALEDGGFRNVRVEGLPEASWVLIDAGTLVVHVFREDLREYYDLELLWGDAPEVAWSET